MTALDDDTARMIADSVAAYARGPALPGHVAELHAQGWLHCALPEEAGGLGFGVDAAALIAGGLARACRAEPVAATYMAARMLALVAPDSAPSQALAEEGRLVSLALGEVGGEGGGLSGVLRHVPPAAVHLVVAGEALCAVPGTTGRQTRVDGVQLETLTLEAVEAERLAQGPAVSAALRQVRAEGRLVVAAELLAHAEVMLEMTLEHLRTRQQFGQSLGQFQALQHKAVDLYSAGLMARAVLDGALAGASGGLAPDDLDRASCRAKARVNDCAMATARGAIQMFGALGITEESPLAPHIKRVLALVPWLGTSAELRRAYARTGRVLTNADRKDQAA
ncbi:acyl-CoA dehydrogenase family protein [Oceanicola sp. 502str15]|uniref:acyl-CoA dehydrogenase family protein n=1 Tax=Oceanicola sp. 502str15 TaxID=2696061 RepID=UPI002095B397|nr:acyl-CoA dehydrogenase family protein [Oceanicola sp. 502str15]MCO6383040.1 hypothetical protein [Oceanicola sp. 502str15]